MRALVACLVVACSSPSPHTATVLPDSPPPDAPRCPSTDPPTQPASGAACNVLSQTGCATGEKCTFIRGTFTTGCTPAGGNAVGCPCAYGSAGSAGYDNCASGLFCEPNVGSADSGVCETICNLGSGEPTCGSGTTCDSYAGLFDGSAGICDPTCDPLTDNDFLGSGLRGSACGQRRGCFGQPSFFHTTFTCTPEIHPDHVHRSPCDSSDSCASPGGYGYSNGCAQGYEPIYRDSLGSSQLDCIAMCKPVDCYLGNCGSNSANLGGAEPHACNGSDARGTFNVASATNNGDQCMYSWMFEIDSNGQLVRSPTSDAVGFCIDHSKYGMPSCDTLPLGSGSGSAAQYGCVRSTLAGFPTHPPSELRRPYHVTASSSTR